MDGYSYADIAGFLETSTAAVRSRLHRGREMLRDEVLKLTKESFDENRLDEKFVIDAVDAAILDASRAYNEMMDKPLSRKKTDEALALIDQVAMDEVKDPVALGYALLHLGMREGILGEKDRAHEHWSRAKQLFEKAGDRDGIAHWRATIAYDRLGAGDLACAHKMYCEAADYWLHRGLTGNESPSAARALESLGLDTDWGRVIDFQVGTCCFAREDGQMIYTGGAHSGLSKGEERYPARMRGRPGPPIGPTPLPLVLGRIEPQLGDTLRFVNGDGRSEESILETLSETVTTPAGAFENCARSSSRIFASNDWTGDVVATRKLWLTPGVGLVRISYQAAGEPADTSELSDFHIETPSPDYVPLSVGNWWKWRWIEGEDDLGFRTEFCRGIVAEDGPRFAALLYWFAIKDQGAAA